MYKIIIEYSRTEIDTWLVTNDKAEAEATMLHLADMPYGKAYLVTR